MAEPKNQNRTPNGARPNKSYRKQVETGQSKNRGAYPPGGVDNVNEVYHESYIVPGASCCLRGGASTSIW